MLLLGTFLTGWFGSIGFRLCIEFQWRLLLMQRCMGLQLWLLRRLRLLQRLRLHLHLHLHLWRRLRSRSWFVHKRFKSISGTLF